MNFICVSLYVILKVGGKRMVVVGECVFSELEMVWFLYVINIALFLIDLMLVGGF